MAASLDMASISDADRGWLLRSGSVDVQDEMVDTRLGGRNGCGDGGGDNGVCIFSTRASLGADESDEVVEGVCDILAGQEPL